MRPAIEFLYAASVGAWATSFFFTLFCDNNPIPMIVLVIVMNVLGCAVRVLREKESQRQREDYWR